MSEESKFSKSAFAVSKQYQKPNLTGVALVQESFRNLVVDNPVLNESSRAVRKMFRPGKAAPIIAISIFVLVYIWLLIQSIIGRTDCSIPFSVIELILLTLFVPGTIYSSISGEREHATWDALILTRLTVEQIIFGKLMWRLRVGLVICLLCVIPICASRFSSQSGETSSNYSALMAQIMLLTWGLLLCTLGLWISSITKRSITSLCFIVLIVLGFLAGLPILYGMFESAIHPGFDESDVFYSTLMTFNPFIMVNTILSNSSGRFKSVWPDGNTGWLQSEVYFVLSVLLTVASYFRLKALEQPLHGRN